MTIIGLSLALLIGIILGLVGGGGAILTIPLVIYFFGKTSDVATTYSLIVVALSAFQGVIQRIGKSLIDFKKGFAFVIPSMVIAFLFRRFRKDVIPDYFQIANFNLSRDFVVDCLLVILMLIVAFNMLQPKKKAGELLVQHTQRRIITYGLIIGILSGLLGAGGGFIIVPVLLSVGLSMKKAVATSMFIVAIQSAIALIGDFSAPNFEFNQIDWSLAFMLALLSILGVFIGTKLQSIVSDMILKKLFAFVLLALACFIFIDRIFLHNY